MTNLFSPNIPNRAAPNAPTAGDPAVQAAERSQTNAAQGVYGRAATLLTSGQGAAAAPTLEKKSLLGA